VSAQWRQFSHVANFTGYMAVMAGHFSTRAWPFEKRRAS
jgi:hypothetical protein